MTHLARTITILYATSAAFLAVGCVADQAADDGSEVAVEQDSKGHTEIHPEDRCDPVTFGALCNPNFHGTTTLAAFGAELDATQRVAAWEYGGGDIRVSAGTSFQVDNKGGETHTFSIVANFGGGRVPGLNTRSGNPVAAPECVAGPNATNVDIASGNGITVTTGANGAMKTKGTFKVQCCIHPWMRTTVTIQ
jgi:plastocyanin